MAVKRSFISLGCSCLEFLAVFLTRIRHESSSLVQNPLQNLQNHLTLSLSLGWGFLRPSSLLNISRYPTIVINEIHLIKDFDDDDDDDGGGFSSLMKICLLSKISSTETVRNRGLVSIDCFLVL